MEFEEALRKASGFIKESKAKGYFLCSAFSSITFNHSEIIGADEWILHFSHNSKNSIDCCVKGDDITVEEGQSLSESELDITRIKMSLGKALESAGFKSKFITMLVSLHGSPPVWTLAFITPGMAATMYDVDAETGKIIREETKSIIRR